jgi:hypothetical protein
MGRREGAGRHAAPAEAGKVGCGPGPRRRRDYVVEHLHDDQVVLVVDETGDV